ncbi:macrophage mannose receptor 1 [Plakobranchus ocellatus]|uniref:Macrophage mannose receptor 1 n=1 Tax=Plakobranchus ocellatus TaxID=259542 RepID=A0AAV4AXR9_9GAST|nr:macrophage mannose receptor 1 [Plakobranchus ocellatus]
MNCLIIFATVLMYAFPSHAETVEDTCPDDIIKTNTSNLKVYKGKCYEFFIDSGSVKQYWEAQEECVKNKGNLAMPKTETLNQFLVDALSEYDVQEEVFIGLSDMKEEKNFNWADGSELMVPGFYENFDKGAGIFRKDRLQYGGCVVLDPLTNTWKDLDCRRGILRRMFGYKRERLFVCEYEVARVKENDNEKEETPAMIFGELIVIIIIAVGILGTFKLVP